MYVTCAYFGTICECLCPFLEWQTIYYTFTKRTEETVMTLIVSFHAAWYKSNASLFHKHGK